jgi:FdhD protein
VLSYSSGRAALKSDRITGEEPMQVRAAGPGQDPLDVAVTMRTPGSDFALAVGFLFTEGLIEPDSVLRVAYCDDLAGDQRYNVVTVRLDRPLSEGSQRNFYATSSCGVCGKASLDQVEQSCPAVAPGPAVQAETLLRLPGRLRTAQRVFEHTGGLHAAGLFDPDGGLVSVKEDVGRHNAVDKVVGEAYLGGELPLAERVLLVSGRAGFEIVQKAAMAGIPVVCAVSAPSSLAVDVARRLGMTLVGFLRGESFNVYAGEDRIGGL